MFEPKTCCKEESELKTRILIMDGHSSHCSLEFLEFAIENGIVILIYPSHCTHALQGLDVVCFAKFKSAWHKLIRKFEEESNRTVKKEDFTQLFGKAFLQTFDEDTIRAAFRCTGVWPFDPSAISPAQMKPSECTSIHSAFPMQLTSPVRRAIASQRIKQQSPKHTSNSITNPINQMEAVEPSTPQVQTRQHTIDPDMFTPSKRMRALDTSLEESSASFLVSDVWLDGTEDIASPMVERPPPVPEPDWQLCRIAMIGLEDASREKLVEVIHKFVDNMLLAKKHVFALRGINEGIQAQLLIQYKYGKKLQQALYQKNKEPSRDNTRLLDDGKGKVLTDPAIVEILRKKKEEQEEWERVLQIRRSRQKDRKEEEEEEEKVWRREKQHHQCAVAAWTKEDARLKANGVPKKQRPAKPKLGRKVDVIAAAKAAQASGGVEGVVVVGGESSDDNGNDNNNNNNNSDNDETDHGTDMEMP